MSMIQSQPIKRASTSQSVFLYITDPDDGLPVTALAYDTTGLLASYAGTKLARVAITLADLAAITTAYASGGFKEVDAANMPGWYRIDVPNAALALAVPEVVVTIYKALTAVCSILIPIPTQTVGSIETKLDIVDTNVDSVLVDTGTTLDAKIDTIDSNVDAVLSDTGTTLDAVLAGDETPNANTTRVNS